MSIEYVKQKAEIVSEHDPLKKIELCGRVCYKSEGKICDGSDKRLISTMIKRGHESVLEHYRIKIDANDELTHFICEMVLNRASTIGKPHGSFKYFFDFARFLNFEEDGGISGNVRVWRNMFKNVFSFGLNNFKEKYGILFEDIEIKCEPDKCGLTAHEDENYTTLRLTTNRGISHELVRHRVFSFSQESTRYCNYSSNMLFIEPMDDQSNSYKTMTDWSCRECDKYYSELVNEKSATPQMARNVLNNSLKTEVVMTGTSQQWKEFLRLRDDVSAHPEMRVLAKLIREELETNKIFPV